MARRSQSGDKYRYARQFREKLNEEIKSLQIHIDRWANHHPFSILGQGEIDSAIGNARLLISSKLQQFRQLTLDAESSRHPKTITADDLAGFWDLVWIQIEACQRQFARLEDLKSRDWMPFPRNVPGSPKTP